MKRLALAAFAVALVGTALPVTFATPAAAATEVAGRPALPTTSVEDLFKMREQWGTKPSHKR